MSQSSSNSEKVISQIFFLPEQTQWIIIRAENSENLHIAFVEYLKKHEHVPKSKQQSKNSS